MVKSSHIVLFFLVLILSHELVSIEARKLMRRELKFMSPENMKTKARVLPETEVPSPRHVVHFGIKDEVTAFRPTTPGHSPGVGHSIHN
ncbi:Transmembrane protein [Parasponia andersonii]|uniref:Transmembrane protein n=1 Tax=Parasponia andersonii TaxID=3476 RepID=A0A2P5B5A6_PARAD|nr:Transmembrane protein [Parasponia andersonii]